MIFSPILSSATNSDEDSMDEDVYEEYSTDATSTQSSEISETHVGNIQKELMSKDEQLLMKEKIPSEEVTLSNKIINTSISEETNNSFTDYSGKEEMHISLFQQKTTEIPNITSNKHLPPKKRLLSNYQQDVKIENCSVLDESIHKKDDLSNILATFEVLQNSVKQNIQQESFQNNRELDKYVNHLEPDQFTIKESLLNIDFKNNKTAANKLETKSNFVKPLKFPRHLLQKDKMNIATSFESLQNEGSIKLNKELSNLSVLGGNYLCLKETSNIQENNVLADDNFNDTKREKKRRKKEEKRLKKELKKAQKREKYEHNTNDIKKDESPDRVVPKLIFKLPKNPEDITPIKNPSNDLKMRISKASYQNTIKLDNDIESKNIVENISDFITTKNPQQTKNENEQSKHKKKKSKKLNDEKLEDITHPETTLKIPKLKILVGGIPNIIEEKVNVDNKRQMSPISKKVKHKKSKHNKSNDNILVSIDKDLSSKKSTAFGKSSNLFNLNANNIPNSMASILENNFPITKVLTNAFGPAPFVSNISKREDNNVQFSPNTGFKFHNIIQYLDDSDNDLRLKTDNVLSKLR